MPSFDNSLSHLAPESAAVLGIPFDDNSSFMHGPSRAPGRIREALHSGSANLCTESGFDLAGSSAWHDVGDIVFDDVESAFEEIETNISTLVAHGLRVLTIGGDHSITYPIIQAYSRKYSGMTILQLDAHPDLYDELEGNRDSHACPFARIMENGLVKRLVQVGVRTMNPHQRQQAERFGVHVIEARDWSPRKLDDLEGPLYLSLDMDVLDPAFAPGVSHHEPGGLSTRDVLGIIQNLKAPLVGADIVEYNPERDPLGITAMVAAKFWKEIVARLLD